MHCILNSDSKHASKCGPHRATPSAPNYPQKASSWSAKRSLAVTTSTDFRGGKWAKSNPASNSGPSVNLGMLSTLEGLKIESPEKQKEMDCPTALGEAKSAKSIGSQIYEGSDCGSSNGEFSRSNSVTRSSSRSATNGGFGSVTNGGFGLNGPKISKSPGGPPISPRKSKSA